MPEARYEPGRSQVSFRVPRDAEGALPHRGRRRRRAAGGRSARGGPDGSLTNRGYHDPFSAVPDLETMVLKTRTALPSWPCSLVAVLGVSACGGGGVPGNSVATVGDQTIKRDTFDHWMKIIAVSQAGQSQPGGRQDGHGARRARLQAVHRRQEEDGGQAGQGAARADRRPVKTQCQQQYDQFRDQVLGFLIRSTWLDQEANRLKVKVADKTIVKQIDDIKKQQFAAEGQLREVPAERRADQRGRALPAAHPRAAEPDHVEGDQGQGQGHRRPDRRLLQQEQVALRLARAPRPAHRADQGQGQGRAGQEGARVRAVVESRGQEVLDRPGLQVQGRRSSPGVAKGQQEPAFDKAIFAAKKGKLTGPVKTQFGWYVFDVTKITPSQAADARRVQGLDQADPGLPEPAERAEEVRRRLPQPVQEGRRTAARATSSTTARTRRRRRPRRRRRRPTTQQQGTTTTSP